MTFSGPLELVRRVTSRYVTLRCAVLCCVYGGGMSAGFDGRYSYEERNRPGTWCGNACVWGVAAVVDSSYFLVDLLYIYTYIYCASSFNPNVVVTLCCGFIYLFFHPSLLVVTRPP
uniref:Uncharacterized protein n=1 Tax=Trypanosoma congolense (strain IL3000) TaxID=1068625 RepID=G0ULX0_TRYCI|nr:hypothetical protein, unlikely [Trypanosoma congolense IL3000]